MFEERPKKPRTLAIKFSTNAEERAFLYNEANRRGISVLALMRRCIKRGLRAPKGVVDVDNG